MARGGGERKNERGGSERGDGKGREKMGERGWVAVGRW
jgi:hypothetical protein